MRDIEVRGLCKGFGGSVVFRDLNLTLPLGRTTVLMGASGIGKTTLLNILMGLTPPDGGEISGLPELQSAVFQEDRLIPDLTVLGNVALGCRRPPDRAVIRRHLEMLGLEEAADLPARELSGGMARRAAVARACLAPSGIIFMDEPLAGLDPAMAQRVIEYIRAAQNGRTILAVLHDPLQAKNLGGVVRQFAKTGDMWREQPFLAL